LVHLQNEEPRKLAKCLLKSEQQKEKNIAQAAIKMFRSFGCTYLCKQTFSIMNMNYRQHWSLTDNHTVVNILKVSTFTLAPDYKQLVTKKQCNIFC